MSDTILGVLIGGAIGVIPTVANIVVSYLQRRHEIRIRKIEIFAKEKIEAITDYSSKAGVLRGSSHSNEFGVDKFLASAQKVACFTSEKTRSLILENCALLRNWKHLSPDETAVADEQLRNIAGALADELSQAYNQAR